MRRDLPRVWLLAQAVGHKLRDARIIVNQQQPHGFALSYANRLRPDFTPIPLYGGALARHARPRLFASSGPHADSLRIALAMSQFSVVFPLHRSLQSPTGCPDPHNASRV